MAEEVAVNQANNYIVVVQMVHKNCTINQLKFKSPAVKKYIRDENIWLEKKILKEAILFAVCWMYGINPKHTN